ncbi:hypothetical protein GGTG_07914 [Gaeumannomyces tritici R3-111a-1]|uniref:Translation initiation factor 3 N-terminal domain-containing protein n=1 Tax=Gaeumannomyces tritici (strain R3-111a-1) TaxID=644352 RepID=J3P323_GAET3|nr:hypothetical protein GGTG_07914 [Gaeumannomyces tritici R3-111a-1]EJT74065.1 hypothetical protein GGTG_07914 [Gaeumannomyces tritici R3-111a-1]
MLCPRALSAAPRPCLVRHIYAAKCRLPADYSGWRPPAAWTQPPPSQQQSRGFKKRGSFKPRVQGVVITTSTGEAERAGARGYGPKGAYGRDKDRRKKTATTLLDRDLLDYPLIHLKDNEAGTLSEPMSPELLLDGMDLETDTLVCVYLPSTSNAGVNAAAEAESDDEETAETDETPETLSKRPSIPICAIMNKEKYLEHVENERKEQRIRDLGTKELEIGWTIDQHDLGHKVRRLREFLGKGYTVRVMFLQSKKKGKKRSANNENDNSAAEVVRAFEEAATEVPGAKQCKRPEGSMDRTYILTFDAPGVKNWKMAKGAAAQSADTDSTTDPDSTAEDGAASSSSA